MVLLLVSVEMHIICLPDPEMPAGSSFAWERTLLLGPTTTTLLMGHPGGTWFRKYLPFGLLQEILFANSQ
jgi:hypothetical protein